MAKKKRPDDEPPKPEPTDPPSRKPRAPKKASKPRPAPSADRARMEAMLRQLMGQADGELSADASPADRAEAALRKAFEADDPETVRLYAREALEAWPDCADAYVLLAENAPGPGEALDLYAEGVASARRVLGAKRFKEFTGVFWLNPETRPFMRALHGLAQVLWVLGRRDEAVTHYLELLRLNPGDNQGVRYNLAAALLELGRDEELSALLTEYREDVSASWAYSAALLAYRREGDTTHARKALAAARKCNKFVPDFLTGREMIPSHIPESISFGGRDEAIDYALTFLNGWRATPGALAWLRQSDRRKAAGPKAKSRAARSKPRPKGPSPAVLRRLDGLEVRFDDVWQVEIRRLPVWLMADDEPCRPWLVLIVSSTDDLILNQVIAEDAPSADLLFDQIAAAMEKPAAGEPHLPAVIAHRDNPIWDPLTAPLDALGVQQDVTPRLDLVDAIIQKLVVDVFGDTMVPGLLEMPGVKREAVASFYQGAAVFFRAAPWQRVGGSETIKVECDRFESGPWYAVVIGQLGMTLGLALYEDLATLARMRANAASDEQNARETVALSVTYGDKTEIAVADLDAIELHEWEVAGPEAYARPIRKERGLVMRPPLAWELQLLDACLRLIPRFIDHHDRAEERPLTVTTPTGNSELTLRLSWAKS